MRVIKRNGSFQEVDFNKITLRITNLVHDFNSVVVDPILVAQKVCASLHDNVSTSELDKLASEISISMMTKHPDYGTLAAYIVISDHQKLVKQLCPTFSSCIEEAFKHNLVNKQVFDIVQEHAEILNDSINYNNDFLFDFFSIKTLQKSYLYKINDQYIENPQYMLMRVSLGIHYNDIDSVIETYNLMSNKLFIHATPTLFNSASKRPQLASCFLMGMKDDSIKGIYDTLSDCATISKWAGGIGLHIHNIRSHGSDIRGTKGASTGIVPMLKVFNDTARYVNQEGKRPGSIAVYLQVDHPDIFNFLDLRKNTGDEEERARDLFYAVWIPDLFMDRVKNKEKWSLFCPHSCPGLSDVYGDNYKQLYIKYENQKMFKKQVDAQELWFAICNSQIETGNPYMLYKDAANLKSNQQNLGTIKSSNLCVHPSTLILTDNGYFPIKSLHNSTVNVYNGKEFSSTTIHKTSENSKLLTVNLSNGLSIQCTEYHTFYNSEGIPLKANELSVGTKLLSCKFPILNLKHSLPHAYTLGAYFSSSIQKSYTLCIPYAKKSMFSKIDWKYYMYNDSDINIILHEYIESYLPWQHVPFNNYDFNSRLEFIAGVLDMNSSFNTDGICIDFNSSLLLFYQHFILLLQTFNCFSFIRYVKSYTFIIPHHSFNTLINVNLPVQIIQFNNQFVPASNTVSHDLEVESIIDDNTFSETYCFNEPIKHMGIFNGVLTGNCTEILEYTSPDEVAVCNLASICLPQFVINGSFDYDKLFNVVQVITKNLNKVIDVTFYPIPQAEYSNKRHRPIGIGVQGLADVFQLLRLPFDSQEASHINELIFETIYFASLSTSCDISKQIGPYETFQGSPISKGIFQFDLWNQKNTSERYDWEELRSNISQFGIRNSLLIAPMPTATTSQIMGNNEAFEPYTSNIYLRRTVAGEFVVINKHLVNELINLNLWNEQMKDNIIYNEGSIQNIHNIPLDIKNIFKTAWEIKQKTLIDMAADRGKYICQSQSLNLFVPKPSIKTLSSMHFYAWNKGLKTGIYYLRTKPAATPQQFTISPPCEACSS